jgi:polar amino acid transport system substrate-binding protein
MVVEDCIWLILKGLLATVVISMLSLLIGTLVGCGLYALSTSKHRWMQKIAQWWKLVVRGTPLMVLILIVFYLLFGGRCPILAASIALGLIFANFVAANLQSSIDAVGRGQMEAGQMLGFSKIQTMRYIVLPQAIRIGLPAYKFQAVATVKGTAVVGYVAIQDLTLATQAIRSGTGQDLLPLLVTTLIYFLLAWLLNKLFDHIFLRISKI